ncbi:hypothetical protein SmJEL517_g05818 [Synchytrium microbalum]|uniref:Alpha/beta hydrolase fold-3 domain-containing protein n=1 Tax=Synchytrium microbalum TaxID=1806994 RepID=A0A507BZI6_9FUNG|nr:uncharacterized protein SmJEL517_g05818 [Synchytrium microbalum]TPX30683.1 hypothetical protein SmJEL517_g05818 [Synchytrium microbalum]
MEAMPLVLYLHGGGFIIGTRFTHRALTAGFARRGLQVLSIDYRRMPGHVYPAQLSDSYSALVYALKDLMIPHSEIIVAGDSAGGNLAYSLAMYIRDNKPEDTPAGLILITPWVDLTSSSPTIILGDEFDWDVLAVGDKQQNTQQRLIRHVKDYSGMTSPTHPSISPIYDTGNISVPIFQTVGTVDRLYAENLLLYQKRIAESAGFQQQLYIFKEKVHDFQMIPSKATTLALDLQVQFVKDVMSGKGTKSGAHEVGVDNKTITSITDEDVRKRLAGLVNRAEIKDGMYFMPFSTSSSKLEH